MRFLRQTFTYKRALFVILTVAFVLRVWGLNKVPPELFGDELDVGYHAYSILQTGKDYYGQTLPTYIHSFSEWRAPLLMYATVPFVAIFGLNEWGVRLPSAVFGLLTIFLLYVLANRTLGGKTALTAALLMAISPWHLQYSRAAFEVNLLLTLILGGTLTFILGLKKHKWLSLAAFLFGLTFYTYSTANVFIPLFVLLLLLIHKKRLLSIERKRLVAPIAISVAMIIPISYQILFGFAGERFGNFNVFNDEEIIREIDLKRLGAGPEGALFYNKPIFWGRKILANYGTSFSPQFLFIDGDVTFRHSVHQVGEFYWWQAPFMVAGFLWFLKKRDRWVLFWLGWLLLAPIPSSLTRDGAIHATRLILMLPPLTILTAAGVKFFLESKLGRVKKPLVALLLLIVAIELGLYLHRYWVDYPKEAWRWWHEGYKEALLFMKTQEKDYETIAFNNTYEPSLIRFLFWWEYPPNKFLKEFSGDKSKEGILPGFNGFSLGGRYYFGSMTHELGVISFVKPGILYLVSQRDEVPGDWDWEKDPPVQIVVLKTVRNPANEPIFYVVTGSRR